MKEVRKISAPLWARFGVGQKKYELLLDVLTYISVLVRLVIFNLGGASRHYFGPGRAFQPGGWHRVAGHINFQGERRMGSAHRNIADAEGSSAVFPAVASSLAGSLAGCAESSVSYYESLQHNEEAEQHLAENAHSHDFGDEEVHGIANPYL